MFCQEGKMKVESGMVNCKVCKGSGTKLNHFFFLFFLNQIHFGLCVFTSSDMNWVLFLLKCRFDFLQEMWRFWIFPPFIIPKSMHIKTSLELFSALGDFGLI